MRIYLYRIAGSLLGLGIVLSCFVLFHLGGHVWQFSQLIGALVGGCVTLFVVRSAWKSSPTFSPPLSPDEEGESWVGKEQLGWTLIGCGAVMWSIGECLWRIYVLALHQSPFPSWADMGYSLLPPLVFVGLLMQPAPRKGNNRYFLLLDSLIAMGSLLAIAWYLLLGSLATASGEDLLAKYLGLYYPTSDIALLSCVFFLLLRAEGTLYQIKARRYGLLILGLGLSIFAVSDFLFNVQQNLGTYVDGTWVDLGWPLGLLTVGIAAAVRRFLPVLPRERQGTGQDDVLMKSRLGLGNLTIYGLVGLLFCVLCINIFSTGKAQIQQRPVLLISVLIIVALVVTRQIMTILENYRLVSRQAAVVQQLEQVNRRMEEQGRMIAQRNIDLEQGIAHLKEVQAQLANGNTRARAQIKSGELLSLAGSFNLMADRLVRTEGVDNYLQRLTKALGDLSMALERQRMGNPLRLPPSYREFPEIKRLLLAMGMSETPRAEQQIPASTQSGDKRSMPEIQRTPIPPVQRDEPTSHQSMRTPPNRQCQPLVSWGQRLKKQQEFEQDR